MQINFNNNDKNKSRIKLSRGDFESMLKDRAKHVESFRNGIQEVLADYNGESIAIIIMKEDENGLPEGHSLFMSGLARPEVQLGLSKALHEASTEAIDLLIEAAKERPEDLIALSKQLIEFMEGSK